MGRWTSVYLRQMDTASGALRLAHHLFHLARKTSTEHGLISCNVIGHISEAVGAGISDTKPCFGKKKQHWETFSGRKKLLHIYLYFHILFTYLFVIIIIIIIIYIWNKKGRLSKDGGRECWRNVTLFCLFFFNPFNYIIINSSQWYSQSH